MRRRWGPSGRCPHRCCPLRPCRERARLGRDDSHSIPLGAPFLYGEYAAGSSSVIGRDGRRRRRLRGGRHGHDLHGRRIARFGDGSRRSHHGSRRQHELR